MVCLSLVHSWQCIVRDMDALDCTHSTSSLQSAYGKTQTMTCPFWHNAAVIPVTIWWSWTNHDTWQQETAVILLSLGKSTQVGSCSHLQLDSALRSCSTVAMMVPDNMTKPLHARKSRTCRQMCPPSSCTFLTRLQYAPRHNVDCPPCNHCYIGMCNVRCTLAARQFALYNKLWGGIAFFTT